MPRRLEDEAIRINRMFMFDRRPERYIIYRVDPTLSQDLYILGIGSQLRQDNRVLIQGIGGSEDCTVLLCAAIGHSFNHDINVPAVVQVVVR